jgi:serine/threonine protein kinase
LSGFPPFYDEDNMALFDKIKKGKFDFPSPTWDHISQEAKDIILNLLVVDPSKRMSCE